MSSNWTQAQIPCCMLHMTLSCHFNPCCNESHTFRVNCIILQNWLNIFWQNSFPLEKVGFIETEQLQRLFSSPSLRRTCSNISYEGFSLEVFAGCCIRPWTFCPSKHAERLNFIWSSKLEKKKEKKKKARTNELCTEKQSLAICTNWVHEQTHTEYIHPLGRIVEYGWNECLMKCE